MSVSTFDQPTSTLPPAPNHPPRLTLRRLSPFITTAALLIVWQGIVLLNLVPSFIIPAPMDVLNKAVEVIGDGRLWLHTSTTLVEIFGGLIVGGSAGMLLGYLVAKNRLLDDLTAPLFVALQSTPVVAYAPLLVIWFGSGPVSKVFTCAMIVFFPILLNTVVGIRAVPAPQRELMRSFGASRWETFRRLEVPSALPVLLGGLKVSATLAVIGAVVGEFVSAKAGLGFLINLARNQYDTALVIVTVVTLAIIARTLYGLVALLERYTLAWQHRAKQET
jgi:NitT/TauT family transport system permease protein